MEIVQTQNLAFKTHLTWSSASFASWNEVHRCRTPGNVTCSLLIHPAYSHTWCGSTRNVPNKIFWSLPRSLLPWTNSSVWGHSSAIQLFLGPKNCCWLLLTYYWLPTQQPTNPTQPNQPTIFFTEMPAALTSFGWVIAPGPGLRGTWRIQGWLIAIVADCWLITGY